MKKLIAVTAAVAALAVATPASPATAMHHVHVRVAAGHVWRFQTPQNYLHAAALEVVAKVNGRAHPYTSPSGSVAAYYEWAGATMYVNVGGAHAHFRFVSLRPVTLDVWYWDASNQPVFGP